MSEPIGFEMMKEQWLNITDSKENDRFYREEAFPLIRDLVVPREQKKLTIQCTHLILPVGMSPWPLILSILILQPQKVFFLYTPGLEGSENFLDEIVQMTGLRISQVDKDEVDWQNIPDIYQKVKNIFKKWNEPEGLIIDISGGKKSMTGACLLAGSLINARFVYIDSDYHTKRKAPVPGSESLVILENPYDVFGDLKFQRAVDLFRQYDYAGAQRILNELKNSSSSPLNYQAREMLCEVYAKWDDWDIGPAQKRLGDLVRHIEQIGRSDATTPLYYQLPTLRDQLNLLERLNDALGSPDYEMLRDTKLLQPMLGTMRACAIRQEKRCKLDVAALLWYRIIEFVSQQRLSGYKIKTDNPDYRDTGKDIEELTRAFRKQFKDEKSPYEFVLPDKIDLIKGYALLAALEDPVVNHLNIGEIRGKVNARNKGLFAHGFRPLTMDEYQRFKSLAEKILENFKKETNDHIKDWETCQFIEVL